MRKTCHQLNLGDQMPKIRELNEAHIRINEWANWCIKNLDSSCIGFASQTIEGRAKTDAIGIQGSKPGPKSPEVMMPPRVAAVDRALRVLPGDLLTALIYKYRIPGTEAERLKKYTTKAKVGMQAYYKRVQLAQSFVAGRLAG